jgi:hypothetical protein
MPRLNSTRIEEEMRRFAEERVTRMVGDAPMLTKSQLARIWNKSPSWVTKMQVAGRVHVVPFGNVERAPRAVAIIGLLRGSVKTGRRGARSTTRYSHMDQQRVWILHSSGDFKRRAAS